MVSPAVSAAMVGRQAQIDELRSALDECRRGHCVTVRVGGEAGAGKTRLVTEFASSLPDDVRTLSGLCVELGGDGVAYAPIAGVMRSMIAEFGAEMVLEWAGAGAGVLGALLPDLDVHDTGSDLGRGRLFEVVAIVLERAAAHHRIFVVIEDLQWADGSTRDLLRFTIRALADVSILIALTYRTDEMTRTHPLRPFLAELDRSRRVHRVGVPRLTRDEVAEQLANIWDFSPDSLAVDRVFRRSEGLPFFVEELACADNEDESNGLSDSLRDLLLVRVEQLARPVQELLRLIAVGGTGVSHPVLASASDLPAAELEAHLREAVSASVLRVDGDGYTFRHALLSEALQDDMLPGEGARLHQQFARSISQQPGQRSATAAMQLAYHLYGAGDYAAAFRAYLDAGDHAATKYAYPEAQFAFERVLEMWGLVPDPEAESGTDHASLLARTASMAKHAGEMERALALGDAALREFGDGVDPDMRTELVLQRARILSDLGRRAAADELQSTLDALPAQGYELSRARLIMTISSHLFMTGDLPTALVNYRRAVEAAEAAGSDDALIKSLTLIGSGQLQLGDMEEGFATLERAKALRETASPGVALGHNANVSDVFCSLGRYEEAAEIALDGIDEARALGRARTLGALIIGNAAEPLIALGRWETAEQLLTRGLELDPPARHFWQLTGLLASLRLWQGDVAAAERTFAEVAAVAARPDVDPQYSIPAARVSADLALARGDADAAWSSVTTCLDATRRVWGYVLPLIGTGARALGARRSAGADITADEQRLRTELSVVGDWGPAPSWRALADAELAPQGDPTQWTAVVDAPHLPAHITSYARMRLGEAHLEHGERDAATEALDGARVAAEKLGAGFLLQLVDDLGRRGGVGGQPTGENGLTPRELEVLRLVAEGCSNGQIGERLFISTKTASVHVSNILAKLAVSSRGEAAAAARDLVDEPLV